MADRKRVTFLIVPHHSRRVFKLRIPVLLTKLLLLVLSVSLVCLVLLIVNYSTFVSKALENRILKGENIRLRDMLSMAEEHMNALTEDMSRLENLEVKLKAMAGFTDQDRNLAIGPVSPAAGESGTIESGFGFQGGSSSGFNLLGSALSSLEDAAEQREEKLSELVEYFEAKRMLLVSVPSVWPVRGWVTSEFGMRNDPYMRTPTMHRGIDIAAPHGTEVMSPSDGVVTFTGMNGGYGKTMVVNHGYGIATSYGHLAQFFVEVGDMVKRGDRVGSVGDTGRSTGPHLHYEVYVDSIPVNPRKFILE